MKTFQVRCFRCPPPDSRRAQASVGMLAENRPVWCIAFSIRLGVCFYVGKAKKLRTRFSHTFRASYPEGQGRLESSNAARTIEWDLCPPVSFAAYLNRASVSSPFQAAAHNYSLNRFTGRFSISAFSGGAAPRSSSGNIGWTGRAPLFGPFKRVGGAASGAHP